MSQLVMTREESDGDTSATPHAVIGLADDTNDLERIESFMPLELESNVLVEYPVGKHFRELKGYCRFVRWRVPVNGHRYGLIKLTAKIGRVEQTVTGTRTAAPECEMCGYHAATEHGRCAVCGHRR